MLTDKQAEKMLKLQTKFIRIFYNKKTEYYNYADALNALMIFGNFFLEDLIHLCEEEKLIIFLNQLKRELIKSHKKYAKLAIEAELTSQED